MGIKLPAYGSVEHVACTHIQRVYIYTHINLTLAYRRCAITVFIKRWISTADKVHHFVLIVFSKILSRTQCRRPLIVGTVNVFVDNRAVKYVLPPFNTCFVNVLNNTYKREDRCLNSLQKQKKPRLFFLKCFGRVVSKTTIVIIYSNG